MGKSKKKNSSTEFNESSICYCDICKLDIKIAFGGEGNWTEHLKGGPHHKNAAAVSSTPLIHSFFAKQEKQVLESLPEPPVQPLESSVAAIILEKTDTATENPLTNAPNTVQLPTNECMPWIQTGATR
ncbi:hypothetical protein BDQ17DRAFT_1336228 [Cyathus striatus]|nr:hypothetical protein BDQ17DRAFT_1336228 [Cyathus striatus]